MPRRHLARPLTETRAVINREASKHCPSLLRHDDENSVPVGGGGGGGVHVYGAARDDETK